MSIRDLLILNLMLQVFDGLFSYQAFSLLGAHEANPFVGAAISSWGCYLRLTLQESFSVRSAVSDFCIGAPARWFSKTGADCDRFGLHVRCCRFSMAAPELTGELRR